MPNYSTTHADLSREIFTDHGDGTATLIHQDSNGQIISNETITGLPVFSYAALDATGALATLLVVAGVLELADAANALNEEPAHLVAEAEAWSLGAP